MNDDTISRRAAIDAMGIEPFAFSEYENGLHDKWEDDVEALMNLPPAQPEIVRCKDCKHHWTHRCMDCMPTEICELGQTFYDANVDFCSLAERRTDGN